MFSLKETRFDEGDDDRHLEIGGGRYVAYDEKHDCYYIWNEPRPMRGKPIEVDAPFNCSVDEVRAFAIDRPPRSVDFVALGIVFRFPGDGLVWVAGDIVGDDDEGELKEEEKGDMGLLPPLHFRYPKEKPPNLSENQLLAKVSQEAATMLYAFCERIGFWAPPNLNLSIFIKADSGRPFCLCSICINQRDEQPARTNTWTMEQLNSSLDSCATATNPTNIWSMEKVNSSI